MFDPKHQIGEVVVLEDGQVGEVFSIDKLYLSPASGCRIPQWKGWIYNVLTFDNQVVSFSNKFHRSCR